MNNIVLNGFWFLPSECNQKVPGNLEYSLDSGIRLRLIGVLNIDIRDEIPFILGITDKGKRITLYTCHCTKHAQNNPGFETQEFAANFLFEGAYFTSLRDLKFKRITFECYNANKWLEFKEGVQSDYDLEKNTIKLELGPSLRYQEVINEVDIKLNINYRVERNYKIYKAVGSQQSYFSIEVKRRKRFEDLFELYLHLKNLLVFFNQIPIVPRSIILRTKQQGRLDSKKVNLYYTEKSEKNLFLDENEQLPFCLIGGKQFQDNFSQYVSNWFLKRDRFEYLLESYFSNFYFTTFTSDKFLTNARVLEGLHREFVNANKNIHLATRYKEVLLKFKKYLKRELKVKNNHKWCHKVKDYRNKLTHNNRLIKSKALAIKDLDKIVYESNLLITSFLLFELNVPMEEIGDIVEGCFYRNRRK